MRHSIGRFLRALSSCRRLLTALLLTGFVAVGLSSCGGDAGAAKSGRLRVAVVPKGTSHDFWQSVRAGAMQAAAKLDVDMDWQGGPEGDRAAQIRLVETLANGRVQGILLAPVDARALQAPVEEAKRAGVPTVVFDSALDGDAHVGFIATDNKRGGELAGEKLGELLGGKGKVLMLRFQEGSASTMAREQGFLGAIGKFDGITLVSDNQHAGTLDAARTKSDALLLAHADVDGIFCPNESTAHGMLAALEAVGKAGVVKFVGFDANPELLSGLEKGHIDALVVQDPVAMGRRGLELLVAHLRGETIEPVVHTALCVATPQNREQPEIAALLRPDLSILKR
ncbi:MAG: substrate-binding domain-containing protein [Planctomycetes bacterium]|nr:substrate-binding domain-containing protein [Planctomycetota bacterium]